MSGSPVAAAALTFFEAGVIDKLGAFAMITGSRLGASFIVLFIGFVYVLRGRNRASGLSMGLLSLSVTGTTYLVGLIIGWGLLQSGRLDHLQLQSGALLNSVIDLVFDPIIAFLQPLLPRWSLFLIGLGIIMVSFNLFDRCLPQMAIKESQVGRISRLVYKPWVMFILGGLVTLISMSVSVSLSILVPLSNRGFVRRENVIPYIMGANITTFIDTLLAAVLLNNPDAFTVVLVEMLSITIVSILILLTVYHRYERGMLALVAWVTDSNRHLAIFMSAIRARTAMSLKMFSNQTSKVRVICSILTPSTCGRSMSASSRENDWSAMSTRRRVWVARSILSYLIMSVTRPPPAKVSQVDQLPAPARSEAAPPSSS
jgi:hypothetical protein